MRIDIEGGREKNKEGDWMMLWGGRGEKEDGFVIIRGRMPVHKRECFVPGNKSCGVGCWRPCKKEGILSKWVYYSFVLLAVGNIKRAANKISW